MAGTPVPDRVKHLLIMRVLFNSSLVWMSY